VLTGALSSLRAPVYRATARVLLRPNDPAEQLNPTSAGQQFADPDRHVAAQANIVESEAVAQAASQSLAHVSVRQIEKQVSVAQGGESDILNVVASDEKPVRARDMANAVAKAYIENRRLNAVAGLQRAADDIATKLGPLQDHIAELDAQIAHPSPAPGAPSSTVPPLDALKGARDAASEQYKTLYAHQQELLVNIDLKRGEAELVAEAKTPRSPVSPKPVRDGALGALVGLLLGVGVSLLREQMDSRLRSPEEVERVTKLRLLAQLPYDDWSATGASGLAVIEHPRGPLSEAIRSLRTSIQFLGSEQPVRVIVVTSALPGEGKSLVAANLAVVWAEAGYSTHLVYGDLRRPSVSSWFGVAPASPGLTDLIVQLAPLGPESSSNGGGIDRRFLPSRRRVESTEQLTEHLVKSPIACLDVLPPGPIPPNPTELLGSRRMANLLKELKDSADIVIIDTPPLLPVTDAAILAARADGLVFVTALGEAHRNAVVRARAILDASGVRILGVVINKTRASRGGDYYAYSVTGSRSSKKAKKRKQNRQAKGGSDAKPAVRDRSSAPPS
jgi:Mrp family chromosome partitioning ATPase/capsular polysaccharide biosynthesis protein